MLHEWLLAALARRVGQTVTLPWAQQLAQEVFAPLPLAPVLPVQSGPWRLQTEWLHEAGDDLALQRVAYLQERYPDRPQRTNWRALMAMQERRALWIFTARDRDGALAASVWVLVGYSLDTGELAASDDLIFVTPRWRGTSVLLRLWRFVEQALFERGVREATLCMNAGNGAQRMARFMGYQVHSLNVSKHHYGNRYADAPTRHSMGEQHGG